MKINFFKDDCLTTTSSTRFGILDGEDGAPAFLEFDEMKTWVAQVENAQGLEVNFYALDGCVEVLNPDGSDAKRCDCFLTLENASRNELILIELKEKMSRWMEEGIMQLKATIDLFNENYDLI